jgi:hypothetical protein
MTVGLTEVATVRRQVNLAIHAIGVTRARVLWRIGGPCRRTSGGHRGSRRAAYDR